MGDQPNMAAGVSVASSKANCNITCPCTFVLSPNVNKNMINVKMNFSVVCSEMPLEVDL